MSIHNKCALILVSAITFCAAGCGGKDNNNNTADDIPTVDVCKGEECATKKADAETKAAACDFAGAYEALNSVYAAQVANKNIDAQTALDRSVLGLIHLAYLPDVQKILPKLGFIADANGLVDFKPLWEKNDGFFHQLFEAKHAYEHLRSLVPITAVKNDTDWSDTIDNDLTIDEILDVLVALRPEIESLASSMEEAARLTGATPLSPSEKIGCGLNNFKVDAADLSLIASFLMIADAFINLVAHYDFNFSFKDYISFDGYYDDSDDSRNDKYCSATLDKDGNLLYDACNEKYSIDYNDPYWYCKLEYSTNTTDYYNCLNYDPNERKIAKECAVFPSKSIDNCKIDYQKDYKSLQCFEIDEESYEEHWQYTLCAIPNDNNYYRERAKLSDMLIPHLFRATTSKRSNSGIDGASAFKKAASLLSGALGSTAKGKFFNFASIPAEVVNQMKDIANSMADGSGDLSRYIKPGIKLDIEKLFNNVIYAKDGDIVIDPTRDEMYVNGEILSENPFTGVAGDEVFVNETLLNYILNNPSFVSHNYEAYGRIDDLELYFTTDDKYDATFADEWNNFDISAWLNPNEYFGRLCEDGDMCKAKCPNMDEPYYIVDNTKPDGYFCSACEYVCDSSKPYCVKNILTDDSYCIDQEVCPEGQQPTWYGCDDVTGRTYYDYCYDEETDSYDHGQFVVYDPVKKEYVCSKCRVLCDDDKPYCVNSDPEEDDSYAYICAKQQSCPTGYFIHDSGICVPEIGETCPDELKKHDICIDYQSPYRPGDDTIYSELYYCKNGVVEMRDGYTYAHCKTIDVSQLTSKPSLDGFLDGFELETMYELVGDSDSGCNNESDVYLKCSYQPRSALTAEVCVETDDHHKLIIDLAYRGLYNKCADGQICSYGEDGPACIAKDD